MAQHDPLRWRAGDTILIMGVLLAAVGLLVGLILVPFEGHAVQVTVGGQVLVTLPLEQDTTYLVEGVGGDNCLVIEEGAARVTVADCPDGICTEHQAISKVGQSIICLPHEVVITVIGGETVVDAEV